MQLTPGGPTTATTSGGASSGSRSTRGTCNRFSLIYGWSVRDCCRMFEKLNIRHASEGLLWPVVLRSRPRRLLDLDHLFTSVSPSNNSERGTKHTISGLFLLFFRLPMRPVGLILHLLMSTLPVNLIDWYAAAEAQVGFLPQLGRGEKSCPR